MICLGLVTSLLLPLQWGGNTKPWGDKWVIAMFCVFGVVVLAFIAWEWKMGTNALFPLYLLKNRSQVGCCLASFWIMLMFLVGIYYLPLYYQAKVNTLMFFNFETNLVNNEEILLLCFQGHSATRSGIDILPFMLMTVAGAMISGAVITWNGRYLYWLIFAPMVATIGAGLLFTMDADMS